MRKFVINGMNIGYVAPNRSIDVSYDNTESGLTATNTQDAIDEINENKVDKETGKGLFSGSYNDLTDKPSLATVATSGSYNDLSNKPSLATVATSGSYNDLSNKPTIPTNTNQLTNGAGFITSSGSCAASTKTSMLDGFGSGGAGNFTWGNQTGTGIWRNNDGGGGEFGFRKNNPSSGQVSMVIDGTVYVNEGRYQVWDKGSLTNLNQLTNGPGYITGINKTMVTNALGYTPPTSDTNNAVTVTHSNSNAQYPICWEGHNNTTTYTTGIYKCTSLTVNPYNVYLYIKHTSDANNYTRIGPREIAFFWGSNNAGGIQRTGQQGMKLEASNESNYWVFLGVTDSTWTLCPDKDNYVKLGSPNHRWNQIYSSSSSINTSDRNEKKDIESLNDNSKEFIMNLNPVSYKFINGDSGRTHYGLIAQDVEETMNKLNMTALDFAGFCKDQKYETYEEEIVETREVEKEDGTTETVEEKRTEEKQRPIEGEYRYGLRYEEFISPLIKTVQLQQNQIDKQQEEIDSLKEEIKSLKELINRR